MSNSTVPCSSLLYTWYSLDGVLIYLWSRGKKVARVNVLFALYRTPRSVYHAMFENMFLHCQGAI